MQSILIVFPEGNIENNPNMLSMLLLLYDYYQIYVVHEREKQAFINDKIHTCYISKLCDNFFFENNKEYMVNNFKLINFSLIIGIDQGIKFANFIARQNNTPLALISYELYFTDEWEYQLKKQEIEACKNIAFAICQDNMRSYLLSGENNIPVEKIVNIPISESSSGSFKRSTYLHEKLNIPSNKKIALYIGSISKWSMTEGLINSTDFWPDEWVLVLHPRYGMDSSIVSLDEKVKGKTRVYISVETKAYTYELEEIVCSADLGIVLYDFDFTSYNSGKNLLFVGLSSGKFSIFMKYNIPIIVNNNTNIADIVFQYNLGYVITNLEDIHLCLLSNDTNFFHSNCREFFSKYLDFDLYKSSILTIIEKTILNENVVEIININNQKISIKNIHNIRMELVYNRMMDAINNLDLLYKNSLLKNKLKKVLKVLHLLEPIKTLINIVKDRN